MAGEHGGFLREISSGVAAGGKGHLILWIVGGAVLVLFLVLRGKSNTSQPAPVVGQNPTQANGTDATSQAFQAVISKIQEQEQALVAINQNQQTEATLTAYDIGANSWLGCLRQGWDSGDIGRNGVTACLSSRPGPYQNTGQWTHGKSNEANIATLNQGAAPFTSCGQPGNYNLACVGAKLAGNPTFQTVSLAGA